MATLIRIIKQSRDRTFGERLEDRARALTELWDSSTISTIEREIVMTLNHIDNHRALQHKHRAELDRDHFYTYNELGRQKRETQYRPYRPNSIDTFRKKLWEIDKERRTIAKEHEKTMERMHDQLLALLNKKMTLQIENGH